MGKMPSLSLAEGSLLWTQRGGVAGSSSFYLKTLPYTSRALLTHVSPNLAVWGCNVNYTHTICTNRLKGRPHLDGP